MWKHPSTSQNCMATIIHCLLEKDIEINVEPKKNHRHEDWLYLKPYHGQFWQNVKFFL